MSTPFPPMPTGRLWFILVKSYFINRSSKGWARCFSFMRIARQDLTKYLLRILSSVKGSVNYPYSGGVTTLPPDPPQKDTPYIRCKEQIHPIGGVNGDCVMEKIAAVVTCDIIRSQKYSTEQRKKIDTILRSNSPRCRELTKAPYRVYFLVKP